MIIRWRNHGGYWKGTPYINGKPTNYSVRMTNGEYPITQIRGIYENYVQGVVGNRFVPA